MLSTLVLPLALAAPAGALQEAVLRRGELWARIDASGVLVETPREGLLTVDGRVAPLRGDFDEWYGISFRDARGAHLGFGGGAADWRAGRERLRALALRVEAERVVATTRIGDLELRHEFFFDADGPYLVCALTLQNLGEDVLRDVVYTRELLPSGAAGPSESFPHDLLAGDALPPGMVRNAWMTDDIPPGAARGLGFSWTTATVKTGAPAGAGVPLALWTSPAWPNGLQVGLTTGVSVGDWNADGHPDFASLQSGELWRNDGGVDWTLAGNLHAFWPPPPGGRYGVAFGDYDEDGLPDIATEPRALACIHLLRNLGGGPNFLDVASDPEIVDVQVCGVDSETNCWGDVDADGDIDLFVPIYPPWAFSGDGNAFYRNLGPTGPGGAFRFQEFAKAGGFENPPPDSARPEGAQLVDTDLDGDLDLYSNGTLYQNVSQPGVPRMRWMTEQGSGIGLHDVLDEGAALGDHDLDGDFDLFIAYTDPQHGVKIWENQGDGTFFELESGTIQSPTIGLGLGLSIEDWDQDGDLDFTTRQVFRKNLLVETGARGYLVQTHAIDSSHLQAATPAWVDWDGDGDLDCVLGNMGYQGHFYENVLYGARTPDDARRFLRVRPVRDVPGVDAGVPNEFGAIVELEIASDPPHLRRRKFTSSSAGYVNQNDYTLHFGLPPDPTPGDRRSDLSIDVSVDFPSDPAEGIWRVDRHVNPALGSLDLASLAHREITVWRSGRVLIDGTRHEPCGGEAPLLRNAGGGLAQADPLLGLDSPGPPPTAGHWVGIDFDTRGARSPYRIRELVIDGELAGAIDCQGTRANVLLVDVSVAGQPTLAGALELVPMPRNDRAHQPVDLTLARGRHYRLVARVARTRASSFSGPRDEGGLTVRGALDFAHPGTCPVADAQAAPLDPTRLPMSFRYRPIGGFEPYCPAPPNSTGAPALISATGHLEVSTDQLTLSATGLPAGEPAIFFYGAHATSLAFGNGVLCVTGPPLARLAPPLLASPAGTVERPLDFTLPPHPSARILPGSTWHFQLWYRDPAAGGPGFDFSDALRLTFCR